VHGRLSVTFRNRGSANVDPLCGREFDGAGSVTGGRFVHDLSRDRGRGRMPRRTQNAGGTGVWRASARPRRA